MIIITKKSPEITQHISNEAPVILVKNFIEEDICNHVRESSHLFTKKNTPKIGDRNKETFWRIDVLPSKVETERIFRTLCIFPEDKLSIVKTTNPVFNKMAEFQDEYLELGSHINSDIQRRPQILHYPVGGGFFDWHTHPRFPNNYGLILNLSKKDRDFKQGQTEVILDNKKVIKLDDYTDIGDLILFRYDLTHRVAPCDPEEDLVFSDKGRWTAVLPLLSNERGC